MARESIAHKLDTLVEKVSDIETKLEVHIERFKTHAEQVEEQREELRRNTDVLQTNTASLQDHMARTDALETYARKIDERFTPVELDSLRKKAVDDWWKNRIILLAKFGGALGALGAMVGIARWLIHSL